MNKREPGTPAPGRKYSKKRLLWFKVIGLFIPLLVLFFLEISLRLFHYGYNPALFIEYPPDHRYLYFNPEASKKYFADQAIATTGNIEAFKKEKDENTTRIFVLGESTTIGYPYFHNASFHRWLQFRLTHSIPDRNFEIINCSLTAVNSYTVLGFARQLVDYQPDAVLIYTGHNEYYGALGVGSTDRIGGNVHLVNTLIWLRGLKLVQLMTNGYGKLVGLFGKKKPIGEKTRMELMVQDRQIPYGSKLFNRGITQFESNMEATLKCLSGHHIPVFISNLVRNEKDLKPFISIPPDRVRFPSFQENLQAGMKAFEEGNFTQARKYLEEAEKTYPLHAACNYYLGKLAWRQGNFEEAQAFFSKAADLDALRFRAPGRLNEIISGLCGKYPDTHLVDSRSVFESRADHRIIGDKLILEHVHPNLLGYALLSDAFYGAMKKAGIFYIAPDREISFEQLRERMPITLLDSLTGAVRIERLRKTWPFSQTQAGEPEEKDSMSSAAEEENLAYSVAFKKLSWPQANETLYNYYIAHQEFRKAKTVVETLVLEYPQEEAYYEKAANLCGQLKEDEEAVFYFRKAFDLSPSFEKARFLFVLYLKMDRPEESVPYLDYAIRNGNDSRLPAIKRLVGEISGLRKSYAADSSNLALPNEIAGKYAQMGNPDAAMKYLNKVLHSDSKNRAALALRAKINNGKDDQGKK
jgi:tetratricopeptide (TPR) repeat protein